MSKSFKNLAFLVIFVASNSLLVLAQSSNGSISGTITDESQAVLPNAAVRVTNTETGLTRTFQTTDDGRFKFVSLPIGSYQVTVEAPNFAKFVQSGIKLLVNQDAVVDVTLKTGGVQETVYSYGKCFAAQYDDGGSQHAL